MKMSLLIVDDEAPILQVLERTLGNLFEITSLRSPREALSLIKEKPFDILLTDERMPEMTGTELIHQLREEGIHTPCVLLTGFDPSFEARKQHYQNEITLIFRKPWKTAELIDGLTTAGWLAKIGA